MKILDCHVHVAEQIDIEKLHNLLLETGTDSANILACSHSKCLSLIPKALEMKAKYPGSYYVFGAPDMSAYFLNKDSIGEYLSSFFREAFTWGLDGIKLLEGKPQMRKALPIPDFDLPVWEPFFKYAEEEQVPILWHVNDPETFWDLEGVPAFAISQGWAYDESYVNNEDQYRQVIAVLSRHPKLKICFAHFFFMSAQLERLADILDRFENVMVDLTPGIEMYENFSKDIEASKAFFLKYSDRIMYGTDIGGRNVLMGEKKSFDEEENLRRPYVGREFLMGKGEEVISSDGHYLIGRDDFVLRKLGLDDGVCEKIFGNNFKRFVSNEPRRADASNIEAARQYFEQRKKLMENIDIKFE